MMISICRTKHITSFAVLLFLIAIFMPNIVYAQNYQIYGVSPDYKIFTNSIPENYWQENNVTLFAAKNEYEPFQLIIRAGSADLNNVQVVLSDLVSNSGDIISQENITIHKVEYVDVKEPSSSGCNCPWNRDRWYAPEVRPFGFDPNAPPLPVGQTGFMPDPLWPINSSYEFDVSAGKNQPIWITIYIPDTAVAGNYSGKIIIKPSNAPQKELTVLLEVFKFTLPKEASLRSTYEFEIYIYSSMRNKWLNIFEEYYGISSPSESRALVDKFYRNYAKHRLGPFLGYAFNELGVKAWPDPQGNINFNAFDRLGKEYFDKVGLNAFTPSQSLEWWLSQSWSPPENLWPKIFKQWNDHFKEKGWVEKAMMYLADEVNFYPDAIDRVNRFAPIFKQNAPDIKTFITYSGTGLDLRNVLNSNGYAAVDILVPHLRFYDENLRDSSKEYWIYTTGHLQEIDHPAIENRLLPWFAWRLNATGLLMWKTTQMEENPWNRAKQPGAWRNGDAVYFYPPFKPNGEKAIDDIVPSMRWELLREGMEDYEYFYMLNKLIKTAKNKGIGTQQFENLLASMDNLVTLRNNKYKLFETDPEKYEDFRKHIAQAIVDLKALLTPTNPPQASIDSISPNPALQNETITFTGHGIDPDGTILAYEWKANNTLISTQASFQKSDFIPGTYLISFRVMDNSSVWSEPANATLIINPFNITILNFTHNWLFAQPSGDINIENFKTSCGENSQVFYFDNSGNLTAKNNGILTEDEYKGGGGIILKAQNTGCSFSYIPSTSVNLTGNWYIISPKDDFNVTKLDEKCGIYSQVFYFDANDKLKVRNNGIVSVGEIGESGGLLVKVEDGGCKI